MQVTIKIKKNQAELSCIYQGEVHKKDIEVQSSSSKNRTSLNSLIGALKRIKANQQLEICIDNGHVKGALLQGLPVKWIHNDWKTSKGKEVANKDLWIYLMELLSKHNYKIT